MNHAPINILIINSDWRDMFRTSFKELMYKLERDQMRPTENHFLFCSWAHESYVVKKDERFSSIHMNIPFSGFKPWRDLLSLFLIPKAVRQQRFRPDVIVIYDLGHVWVAQKLKEEYGAPVVMCLTNMPAAYSATRRFGWIKSLYSRLLEKLFAHRVDVGYTINATMRDFAIQIGIPKEKVLVFASDTIHQDLAYIAAAKKGVVRARHHIRDDQKIIFSVGRLEAEKDYARLLTIFAQLDTKYVLVIVGRGSLQSELEAQAKKLGVSDRVIFAGFVHRDDLWNYYIDADVFVLLSKVEALGLVFWEAMYMNVPIIGSTAPGIVETAGKNGDRGMLVALDERIESIQKKLDFCLTPSPKRDDMCRKAKQYVEDQLAHSITIHDTIGDISKKKTI